MDLCSFYVLTALKVLLGLWWEYLKGGPSPEWSFPAIKVTWRGACLCAISKRSIPGLYLGQGLLDSGNVTREVSPQGGLPVSVSVVLSKLKVGIGGFLIFWLAPFRHTTQLELILLLWLLFSCCSSYLTDMLTWLLFETALLLFKVLF